MVRVSPDGRTIILRNVGTSSSRFASNIRATCSGIGCPISNMDVGRDCARVFFPSEEMARRFFLAIPNLVVRRTLDNAMFRECQVAFHPETRPDSDPANLPGHSLLMWTDDTIEKAQLWEHLSHIGPLLSVRKCAYLEFCFVATFKHIGHAKLAMATFNQRFSSRQFAVLGFFKKESRTLWLNAPSITEESLRAYCTERRINMQRIVVKEDIHEALITLNSARGSTMAEQRLREWLSAGGSYEIETDFVELEFGDSFLERSSDVVEIGSPLLTSPSGLPGRPVPLMQAGAWVPRR